MAQALVPMCLMFIQERLSGREPQALSSLPHQRSDVPLCEGQQLG